MLNVSAYQNNPLEKVSKRKGKEAHIKDNKEIKGTQKLMPKKVFQRQIPALGR